MNLLENMIELLIDNIHKYKEIHSKRIYFSHDEINFRLQSMYSTAEINRRNDMMCIRGMRISIREMASWLS